MKTKRVIMMLAFAILVVAMPIWAAVNSSADEGPLTDRRGGSSYIRDGVSIVGADHPVITLDVYGYGSITASNPYYGDFLSGSQVDPGTVITFVAQCIGEEGFEFLGWRINGIPYRGPVSEILTLTVEEDVHVMAVFDHPWAQEVVPPPEGYTHIASINAISDVWGVQIRIPGHSFPPEMEYFTTDVTVEFRITPPENRFFSDATSLNVSSDIEVTHGPTIAADGRLFFTMLALPPVNDYSNGQNANITDTDDDYTETSFAVVFYLNQGSMPTGINAIQSLTYGHIIDPLPVPTREGYRFVGWQVGNIFVAPPLTITTDLELRAIWVQQSEEYDQFAVGFNPAPGSFTDTNETGIRIGGAGELITDMPANPTRSGYTFGGWRLPNGNTLSGQMTIVGDMLLTAIWNPNPSTSSTPSPSSSPAPSATPRPSATPAPGQTGHRPNPQTNPLTISFMIFGCIALAGTAVFGITKLARKQLDAKGQYQADMTRYNRESRLVDIVENDDLASDN